MSVRALALDWSLDGPVGMAFLVLVIAAAVFYVSAAAHGRERDRRHRSWPVRRTGLFLAGLAVLVLDVYSGIGTEADMRLSVHAEADSDKAAMDVRRRLSATYDIEVVGPPVDVL
jgi:hypothetical protein